MGWKPFFVAFLIFNFPLNSFASTTPNSSTELTADEKVTIENELKIYKQNIQNYFAGSTWSIRNLPYFLRNVKGEFRKLLEFVEHDNNKYLDKTELSKVDKAIIELKESAVTDAVLERFNEAYNAFKRVFFPFANSYLPIKDVPKQQTSLQLIKHAIDQTLSMEIRYLETKVFSSTPQQFTFSARVAFEWTSEEMQNDIVTLLQGGNITLKADIAKPFHSNIMDAAINAIKFNKIDLVFELENESLQQEFDAAIVYYDLRFTMVDKQYYKCFDQVCSWPADDITFYQSFGKTKSGTPVRWNSDGKDDPFLSPFATWRLRISYFENSNEPFRKLDKFKNEKMSIKIIFYGSQVCGDSYNIVRDVCNDKNLCFNKSNDSIPLFDFHI